MTLDDIANTMKGEKGKIVFEHGQAYSVAKIETLMKEAGETKVTGALLSDAFAAANKALYAEEDIVYDVQNRCVVNDIGANNQEEVKEETAPTTTEYGTKVENNNTEEKTMEEIRRQLAFGTDNGKEEMPIIAGTVIDGKELADKFRGQDLRVTNMDTYIKKGETLEDGTYVAIQVDVMGENGVRRWVAAPYRCEETIKKFIQDNKYTADAKYAGARFPELFKDEEYFVSVADQDAKLSKDGVHYNAKYDIYKK